MEAGRDAGTTTLDPHETMIDYFASFPGRKAGCLAGEQGSVWWAGVGCPILAEGADFARRAGVEVTSESREGWSATLVLHPLTATGSGGRVDYEVRRSRDLEGEIVHVTYFRRMDARPGRGSRPAGMRTERKRCAR